jgi:flagellin
VSSGLSIANNLLANNVSLNLNKNQAALQTSVTRLSSGLRINSAADDPSGLAIAEKLQAQVNGFDQAVSNVQDANNAATVADGALQTTTDILQRIRSLAVEASSDITSPDDKTNLQAEVSQLLLEVNRISQNTNFNGSALLDGSHAGFQPQQQAFVTITSNTALAAGGSASGGNTSSSFANLSQTGVIPAVRNLTGLVAGQTYTITFDAAGGGGLLNYAALLDGTTVESFGGNPQPLTPATATFTATGADTLTITAANVGTVTLSNITVTGSTPTPAGVNTGLLIATAVAANANFTTAVGTAANGLVDVQGFTPASAATGFTSDGTIELQVINTGVSIAIQETFFDSVVSTGNPVSVASTLLGGNQTATLFDNVAITTGNISAGDVGTTAYLKVSQNVAASSNPNSPAFNFQSGAAEGSTIQVGFAATNTNTLRISNINLLNSTASSPSIGSEDAIGQIDNALERLLNQRSQLGAVIVRLNEDADNDNVAAVNLQASESQIRDLNVGQETTNFTRLQILVQVGTSVLSQSNSNAQTVLGLFR